MPIAHVDALDAEPKPHQILEALLLTSDKPLSLKALAKHLGDGERDLDRKAVLIAIEELKLALEGRGIELVEVASGYRLQVRAALAPWVGRLQEEKPPRYSRALLETLVLVAYRQPITRAEIEEVRGVGVSTHIIKTLLERQWVRVVGHKEVPGRPALYATTREFLDYFNLTKLEDLPSLPELKDLDARAEALTARVQEEAAPDLDATQPIDLALQQDLEPQVQKELTNKPVAPQTD